MPHAKKLPIGIDTESHKPLFYTFASIILFWGIFDGIMTYAVPILITDSGFSNTSMGIIYASSSIVGGIFDFLTCRIFKNIHYRRAFLLMFGICLIYPLVLWSAHTLWIFLLAMALWGIYFDMYGFGTFNFVSLYSRKKDYTTNFGLILTFRALSGIIAPLLAGIIIVEAVDWKTFSFAWIFLIIAIIFFIVLHFISKKYTPYILHKPCHKRKNLLSEIHIWKKLGKTIYPVLTLSCFLFFIESFFWTLAPLYVMHANLGVFSGIFLTSYTLPALFVGWIVGSLSKKFGKKRTAFISLLIGCAILATFSFWSSIYAVIGITLLASFFINLAMPSINGAYTDYISEKPIVESEIEGLEDLSMNVAYIAGPITAGIITDIVGIANVYSLLGCAGVILALILLKISPKHITIKLNKSDLK